MLLCVVSDIEFGIGSQIESDRLSALGRPQVDARELLVHAFLNLTAEALGIAREATAETLGHGFEVGAFLIVEIHLSSLPPQEVADASPDVTRLRLVTMSGQGAQTIHLEGEVLFAMEDPVEYHLRMGYD